MADDFDPYHKWLNIPPSEQPPNHYRLLGVEPLASDGDAVGRAAGRLISYLQARAKGKNGAHAERLLEDVIAARACLLDPASKAEYDAGLRDTTDKTKRAETLDGLGLVYDKRGNVDRAMEYYKRAIAADPEYAYAYNNLGVAYEKKGMVPQATYYYKRALAKNPNMPNARKNLERFSNVNR